MSHDIPSEAECRKRIEEGRRPTRDEWRDARHPHCMVCGKWLTNGLGEVHEIARGAARQKALKEPATWILTCHECHEKHLDGMDPLTQYAIKWLEDKSNYNAEVVNVLRGRAPGAILDEDVLVEVARLRDGGEPYMNPYRWVG